MGGINNNRDHPKEGEAQKQERPKNRREAPA